MRLYLLAGLLSGSCALAAGPPVAIAPSPHPQVLIQPLTGSDPAAAAFVGDSINLLPMSFYLANQTPKAITAVDLLVKWTTQDGKRPTASFSTDSYLRTGQRPILQPGSRMLVTPAGSWIPDDRIASWVARSGGGNPLLRAASDQLRGAVSVNVSLDCIAFADGEVDGLDTMGTITELAARKRAADSVAAALGGSTPQQAVSAMFQQAAVAPPPRGDAFAFWQQKFAGDALRRLESPAPKGSPMAVLVPNVPQFYYRSN